jgi:regulator of sigma E protease
LQAGDVIIGYGDRSNPSLSEIQEINRKQAGQKTEITVLRNGETKTLWVAPKDRGEANGKRRVEMGIFPSSDTNHLILAAVQANSPAAIAGLKSGDVIESANGLPVNNWRDLFTVVDSAQGKPLKLTYLRGSRQATAELGVVTPEVFQLSHYQCDLVPIDGLKPLSVTIHKSNPVEAMAWGLKETWDWLVINYATLRALVGRTVDTSALSGPLGMGKAAMDIGREGSLNQFVYFIALISAALAVFNFLPLPVVDGGYAVMLLLEKIRGKPLSVKLTNIIQFTGLALLLVVFILLTWQDAVRIWQGMW